MHTLVIVNPVSANGKTGKRWPSLYARWCAAKLEFDVALTQHAGHAETLASQAAARGYTRVVSVGGDGTVNEVVNGLMKCAVPPVFAVIPCGTGSDFARALGIRDTPAAAVHLLQHGIAKPVDVGVVECQYNGHSRQRYFINIADAGFGGDVIEAVNRSPKHGGSLSYFTNVFKVLSRYQNKPLRVTLKMSDISAIPSQMSDIYTVTGRFNAIIVANGNYFGGGMRVAPHAQLDDGAFDVVLIGDTRRAEFIAAFPLIYLGKHLSHPKVNVVRATRVHIEPQEHEDVAMEAEGESLGTAPAEIFIVPKALQVLCLP